MSIGLIRNSNSLQSSSESPKISPILSQVISSGQSINITPTLLRGNNVVFTASNLPSGVSINSTNGNITGTLNVVGQTITKITAGNRFGEYSLYVPIVVYNTQINMDSTWLSNNGPPYYLTGQYYRYVLTQNLTVTGTAFYIGNKNITLDLSGYTIVYGNEDPILIYNNSFEIAGTGANHASGWDFSSAPSGSRYSGSFINNEVFDGQYSLRFTLPASGQRVVSTGTITLQPNITYSLSAMLQYGTTSSDSNPGVLGYVALSGTGNNLLAIASKISTNTLGMQFVENTYKTSGTTEQYYIIAGISGGGGNGKTYQIDDIRIQRYRPYGVATPRSFAPTYYPDADFSKTVSVPTYCTIRNGNIVQGSGSGSRGHGILFHTAFSPCVDNLNIIVNGPNSSCVAYQDQSTFTGVVSNNTLTSNIRVITTRDYFDGAVIAWALGYIFNNNITNGPHAGIVGGSTNTLGTGNQIFSNSVSLRGRYTNGFAIFNGGAGCSVYDNNIDVGTSDYAGRGIAIGGDLTLPRSKLYNNIVHVKYYTNHQEYNGDPLGGAYGIQLENGENIEVFDNTVYAYGNDANAYAFRQNVDGGAPDGPTFIHNNSFYAITSTGGKRAACTKFTSVNSGFCIFENNTLYTTDGFVGQSSNSAVILKNCNYKLIIPTFTGNLHPVEYWFSTDPSVNVDIAILNPRFINNEAKSYLLTGTTNVADHYGGAITNRARYLQWWTTSIYISSGGTLLNNAGVLLSNSGNDLIYSGNTESNGIFKIDLPEFHITGSKIKIYSPYTVRSTYNGIEVSGQFTLTGIQTVNLSF